MRGAALLAFGLVSMAHLPARADAPLLPDLQRVVDAGELVVSLGKEDFDPVVDSDESGRLRGFDVDLARALAAQLGVKAKFVRKARTPDEIVEMVARGEADIGLSLLSATAARARHVLFTRPYATQRLTVFVNRRSALHFRGRCPTVLEVGEEMRKSGQVGVLEGGAEMGWVRERLPDAQPAGFESLEALFDAVREGKVRAAVQGEVPALRLLNDHPAASIQLRMCVLEARPDHIAIAVRPDAPGLARWIDAFLQERAIDFDARTLIGHEGPWTFRKGDPLPK